MKCPTMFAMLWLTNLRFYSWDASNPRFGLVKPYPGMVGLLQFRPP